VGIITSHEDENKHTQNFTLNFVIKGSCITFDLWPSANIHDNLYFNIVKIKAEKTETIHYCVSAESKVFVSIKKNEVYYQIKPSTKPEGNQSWYIGRKRFSTCNMVQSNEDIRNNYVAISKQPLIDIYYDN
jgi:hypothetical protein